MNFVSAHVEEAVEMIDREPGLPTGWPWLVPRLIAVQAVAGGSGETLTFVPAVQNAVVMQVCAAMLIENPETFPELYLPEQYLRLSGSTRWSSLVIQDEKSRQTSEFHD